MAPWEMRIGSSSPPTTLSHPELRQASAELGAALLTVAAERVPEFRVPALLDDLSCRLHDICLPVGWTGAFSNFLKPFHNCE